VDNDNCAVPNPAAPADVVVPCFYCTSQLDCSLWGECQPNNYQTCIGSVIDVGLVPCVNYTLPITMNRSCQFTTTADRIDFSSNELVDLNDPFNRGILPDIFNGIIDWMSTPFLYWLLIIVGALTLFLSAVAVLYWVRNMR